MILVSQVFGLVEDFNTGIFADTINVITVELCMMVLPSGSKQRSKTVCFV